VYFRALTATQLRVEPADSMTLICRHDWQRERPDSADVSRSPLVCNQKVAGSSPAGSIPSRGARTGAHRSPLGAVAQDRAHASCLPQAARDGALAAQVEVAGDGDGSQTLVGDTRARKRLRRLKPLSGLASRFEDRSGGRRITQRCGIFQSRLCAL
jgi:hypothetical protein